MKNLSNLLQPIFIYLKRSRVSLQGLSPIARQSLLIISILAVSTFFLWYRVFEETISVEIKMSAPGVEIARAYWDNPDIVPDAYEEIIVKPIESQMWDVKIEALGEKNPESDGFEVAILDIKTDGDRLDWSQGNFAGGEWEFRLDSSGPQGKVAIAHSNKEKYGSHPSQIQSLSFPIEGKELQIKFLANTGSGKVRITANHQSQNLDLHSYGQKYETINFHAGKSGDRKIRDYEIEIPDRFGQKLTFLPNETGKIAIEEVKIRNKILTVNSRGEYIVPFHFGKREILAILLTLITIIIVFSTILIFSFNDFAIIFGFTIFQGIWTILFESIKVGILNTLPTFIFLSIWYFFIKISYPKKRFWQLFSLGVLLVLRIPITVGRSLEFLNWMIYFVMVALAFKKIFAYYKLRKKVLLLITTFIIIWFNAFTHISHNSPYTYVNRSLNFYWECPHETYLFMVNCDHGHYLAEEFIFTEHKYEASFSAKLRRFFYGYLSSLIGFSGHRWVASFTINLLLWMLSCVALYKICILTNLGERIASIAMLCCASSWGFISFVGQPTFYMAAYAYSAIIIWATLEIIGKRSKPRIILLSLIILSGTLIYDIYPLTLSSFLVLLFGRKTIPAISILVGQLALSWLWKNVYLMEVLGTIGDQDNVKVATESLKIWAEIITTADLDRAFHWLRWGTQSFIYGNMIFGAIAAIIFIVFLWIKWMRKQSDRTERILLLFSFLICFLVWMATLATIPKASEWAMGGGMLPRLAFYAYPIGTIALAFLGNSLIGKKAYMIPLLTFLIAHIDMTGLATVATFFDYGKIGIYWK
jgi:hypothetical protein